MKLPVYRNLHGSLDQITAAYDHIETTHRVIWRTLPYACSRPFCYRLQLIAFPSREAKA